MRRQPLPSLVAAFLLLAAPLRPATAEWGDLVVGGAPAGCGRDAVWGVARCDPTRGRHASAPTLDPTPVSAAFVAGRTARSGNEAPGSLRVFAPDVWIQLGFRPGALRLRDLRLTNLARADMIEPSEARLRSGAELPPLYALARLRVHWGGLQVVMRRAERELEARLLLIGVTGRHI